MRRCSTTQYNVENNTTRPELEKESRNSEDKHIFVKSEKRLKKLFLKDILFVESMENYVIIHTSNSKEIVYTTLKQIADSLSSDIFLQVHRSYVINVGHVNSIEGSMLNIDKHKIPVARNLKEKVFDIILNKKLISRDKL